MRGPDHSLHRVADYIPQSVLRARHYGLQIACYPVGRFIEPAIAEERALVLAPANDPPGATRDVRLACLTLAVAFVVLLYFLVPMLIGS